MDGRLTLDYAVTRNKKSLKQEIILNTWKNLLKNEDNLPKNWLNMVGVLVGINPMVHQVGIPWSFPKNCLDP
jgi:hypothetical protein